MKTIREYILDVHPGIIYLFVKNKNAIPFVIEQYAFQRYRVFFAIHLDKKFGQKYEELFLCENEDELNSVLTEIEELAEKKKLDEEFVYDFLLSFEMEGSYSTSLCKKIYAITSEMNSSLVDYSHYLDAIGQAIKSRKRLYWKYDLRKNYKPTL